MFMRSRNTKIIKAIILKALSVIQAGKALGQVHSQKFHKSSTNPVQHDTHGYLYICRLGHGLCIWHLITAICQNINDFK